MAAQARIAGAQAPDDASITLCDQQVARYVEGPDGGLIPVAQENCAVLNTDNGVAVAGQGMATESNGGATAQTDAGGAVAPTAN